MLPLVVNHLWQSTLFVVAVAVIARVLHGNGAHARYWLYWAASAKFLVPASLLTAVGRSLAEGVPQTFVFTQWSTALGRLAEPMTSSASPPALVLALAALWAAGFAAVVGYWIARAVRIRAIRRSAERCTEIALPKRAPIVMSSAARVEPAMVGVFRPVLLLPQGIVGRLPREQLAAVIEHELCHWRRRDNLTAAVHMLVEALFWFHPLVWWIGARLVAERERACDEAVIAAGHDRAAYAEGILNVCELYVASPLTCAAGVSGADLKRRITDIVRSDAMNQLHVAKKLLLATAACAALGLPIAVGLMTGAPASAQDGSDARWVPSLRVAPAYPKEALEGKLQGAVTLEFTVTKDGATQDVVAVDSTSLVFEQAAIDALRQWQWPPHVVNGQPVELRGVNTVIRFMLEP